MSDRRRVDDPESLRADTVTTVLRRMLVLALAGGCPTILVNIVVVGPTDPFVRWAFPPLLVHLLVYGWVLVRRPAAALWFSRLTLVAFEAIWVVGMVVRLRTADDATAVWHGLFPTTFMGPVVFLVVGFLVCASRGALRNAVGLGASFLLGGLYGLLPAGEIVLVRDLVRYVFYLGVVAVLLHVLSHAKARLALSVAAAEQARDEALHLRDIAYRDSLTGIANRRRLVEELTFRAERVGPANPVAVVYFDLDHFKSINDEHGHGTGDEVLCRVADVASRVVRQEDVVGRLGGEEFVIVSPGTTHERALQLAERLRELLPAEIGTAMGLKVTASFGVVSLMPGEGASAVLGRVDELMYQAKSGGRDRVVGGLG